MTTLTECPYCGQPIGSSQLKRIHEAEAESRSALRKSMEAELHQAVDEANAARNAAENRVKQIEKDVAANITEAVAKATKNLTSDLEKVRSEASQLESDLEARVDAAEEKARQDAQAALYKDIHEKDQKLTAAQKTIDELQKKLEGKPAHELGKFQEDDLVRILQAEFPRDRVRRIPERAGADIEHEVFQDGEACGLIVYESKNAATWSGDWVPKLKTDALNRSASACILVSQAFPAKTQDFTSVDGVPVIHPRFLLSLVRVVRNGLIDVSTQASSQTNSGYKLEQLMTYLNGPDFRNRIQALFGSVRKLEDMLQKERKAHDKTWKEQGTLYRSISTNSDEIDSEVKAILLGR